MTNLEKVIQTFENWNQPWTFNKFVLTSNLLNEKDKELFREFWIKAGSVQIWNQVNIGSAA
jgi:hypothetical protein